MSLKWNVRDIIPKVGGLQARGTSLCNVQDILEMLIQGIEQAVAKAPEEEEDGDEGDWEDGLAQSELGGAGTGCVVGLEGSAFEEAFGAHGCWRSGL